MSLIIDLSPRAQAVLRSSALQNNKSVKQIVTQFLEMIFSGKTAYIILEPAPTESQMIAIKAMIMGLINPPGKGPELIEGNQTDEQTKPN